MDIDKPKDLKMKGKVKEEQDDELKNSKMIKKSAQDQAKIPSPPPGFPAQPHARVFEYSLEAIALPKTTHQQQPSSKRKGKRPVEATHRQPPSSIPDSTLKLVEEIVRVYGNYIDHVIEMGRARVKDENNWHFDATLCEVLANVCVQKVQRLRCKLEEMKKDLNYSNVCEIVNQLENIHESFHQSPNIQACAMPKCTKEQLISCEDELQHIKKQLCDITARIGQLRTNKKQPILDKKNKNLRIGN